MKLDSFSVIHLNSLDYIILLVIIAVTYDSIKKGFALELRNSTSLVLALIFTYVMVDSIEPYVLSLIHIPVLSAILSHAGLFVVLILLFNHIIGLILPKLVSKGTLDKFLGMLIGIIKSTAIFLVAIYFINLYFAADIQPSFIKESWFKEIFESILNVLIIKN